MTTLTLHTVDRDSFFTRLDFRSKLALMAAITLVAFVWESPVLGGLLALVVALACLAAGVKFSYLRTVIMLLLPFAAFMILMQGFLGTDLVRARLHREALTPIFTFPASWALIGGGMMTWEGVLYALNVICKTLTMILVLPLGIFTTDVNAMVIGMVKAHIPYKIAYIFSSTLRFFPLLFEEIQTIIEAQRLRGLAFETMGPLKRLRVYAKIAVPLILGALVKSQMLDIVLQSKAFTGSPERTYLHETRLRAADYAVIVGSILFVVAAAVAYVSWGIGRFGKW
ncbi:MAG TPA: energy-coupling factor transporter transmembrane component T [Anaerolineae bacterium]|nr:energy-coupling factor transporter transmembrane component T [Anaerolineae bacterium]HQI84960.1 energy-coupling factor transporter transmembrane component T [Anaerolineae bacterium]